MKTLRSLLFTLAVALCVPAAAFAAVPWGAIGIASGTTPVCTSFSTDPVCIDTMGTNQTSLTLSGGTAGSFYTLILQQDGTGSRTFTAPTNLAVSTIPGAPASIPAPPSAANTYTVWVLEAVGATPTYQLVNVFDNLSLTDVFSTTQSTLGTGVTSGTTQSQGSVVIPGVTLANVAVCSPQTTPATWQTGIFLDAICGTNFCQCQEVNPTAATITPATVTLNIRLVRP